MIYLPLMVSVSVVGVLCEAKKSITRRFLVILVGINYYTMSHVLIQKLLFEFFCRDHSTNQLDID